MKITIMCVSTLNLLSLVTTHALVGGHDFYPESSEKSRIANQTRTSIEEDKILRNLKAETGIQGSRKLNDGVSGRLDARRDSRKLRVEMDKVSNPGIVDSLQPIVKDDYNLTFSTLSVKKTIKATIISNIVTEIIKIRCEALDNSRIVKDFGYKVIFPLTSYLWKIEQVDYHPNVLMCIFLWEANYMSYPLYSDSPRHTAIEYSYWLVDREGLRGYIRQKGLILVQPWNFKPEI